MSRRLCLVTGASSGIGAAFARRYARAGYDVALTARRGERLEALAAEIRAASGIEALVIPADLADPAASDAVLGAIEGAGRGVDALVNNAGYGLADYFVETAWPEQRDFLQVLVVAPCELARKALPGMLARRFGRIINVASVAGLTPGVAGQTLYPGAKALLVRFSQSLNLETRGQGVNVSALCPGFTYSEFHDVTGTKGQVRRNIPRFLWQDADEVAAAGYAAVEANRAVCVPGAANKAVVELMRLMPPGLAFALAARESRRFRKG